MNTQRTIFQPARETLIVRIRPMLVRDVLAVMVTENSSFEFPWTEGDFVSHIDDRDSVSYVAESSAAGGAGCAVGYMVYHVAPRRIELLNLAVHPQWRRRGVGTQLLATLAGQVVRHPGPGLGQRQSARAYVRESNLPAQLFLRSQGWRCDKILRGYYDDSSEDAYRMVLRPWRQEDAPRRHREHGGGGEYV
jgi:ribosomal-protein-alanine N-acetyltransferase